MHQISPAVQRLELLCRYMPPLLRTIDEAKFSDRPASGKWSRKEILGHLIDSAANNHHRFIRSQYEDAPRITYEQDAWVMHSYYHKLSSSDLIGFWEAYNRHLLRVITHIPDHLLERMADTGNDGLLNIATLTGYYVAHTEHHLQQIIPYQL